MKIIKNTLRENVPRMQDGFTFIEMILYVAIVTIVTSSLIPFAWNVIEGAAKSNTQQEVYTAARYVSERLKYEIRKAGGIDTVNSNFDVNLANDTNQKLTLTQLSPDPNAVINVATGKVQIAQNGNPAVALNATDTKVTNLTFSNYSSADNKTKQILFTLTVETDFAQIRHEFKESVTLRSSAEIRSN